MDGSITVPGSVFVNGQWATAYWMADVVDDETGELVITATLAGEGGQGPVVTALRMDMGLARRLRAMALSGAEQPCYDCRTNGERLATIERGQEEDAVTFGEHLRRLLALETAMRSEHKTMHDTFNLHHDRMAALEAATLPAMANREWMDEVERQLAALGARLTAQAQQVQEFDRRKASKLDQAIVRQLTKNSRKLDALAKWLAPAGHRHDGGRWISCSFCGGDDLGRNCVLCNGTGRIWEMPAEDGA